MVTTNLSASSSRQDFDESLIKKQLTITSLLGDIRWHPIARDERTG